ncbi:hypothetical protein KY313_00385 [Candidatus Woesearchaeota archaeon]|jgi:hypothetical protein|nr:hypothetical protein [Candidatus Woesearchaeota archaeon]
MKNKKLVMMGLLGILIIGVVSVFAIGSQNKYDYKGWKKFGDYTHKNFYDKSAWLEKLGLPSDATKDQIMEAKKEHWGKGKANHMFNFREKLGLSDDASEEEVNEAWQKWKGENKFYSKEGYKGEWCGK